MKLCVLPLALVLSCGGSRVPSGGAIPVPTVDVPIVVDADSHAPVEDAGPPLAIRKDCWNGSGDVLATPPVGAPVPAPVSKSAYPLLYPLLSSDEKASREAAFTARYPGMTFKIDDFGVVLQLTTDRMPCEVKDASGGQLTMKTYEKMKKFAAKLESEMSDVVGLGGYGASLFTEGSSPNPLKLAFRQVRDVPEALLRALPKELDDAALLARFAGARIQWVKIVRRDVVIRTTINPCAGNRSGMPCDPPGNTRMVEERPVLGERPFGKRYVLAFERRVVATRLAKGLEIRKLAKPELDTSALAKDIFGSENSVKAEGENETVIVGNPMRDVVNGEGVPLRW